MLPMHTVDAAMAEKCFKLQPMYMTQRIGRSDSDQIPSDIFTNPLYQPVVRVKRLKIRPAQRSLNDSPAEDQYSMTTEATDGDVCDQSATVDSDGTAINICDHSVVLVNTSTNEPTDEQNAQRPHDTSKAPTTHALDPIPIANGHGNIDESDELNEEPTTMMEVDDASVGANDASVGVLDNAPKEKALVAVDKNEANEIESVENHPILIEDDEDDGDDAHSIISAITVLSQQSTTPATIDEPESVIAMPLANNVIGETHSTPDLVAGRQILTEKIHEWFGSIDDLIESHDSLRKEVDRQKQQIESQRNENTRLKGIIKAMNLREARKIHERSLETQKMKMNLEDKAKADMARVQYEHCRQIESIRQEAINENKRLLQQFEETFLQGQE